MQFDFETLDRQQRYKLLGATVTPRPIAWVSSLGADGTLNAAPFSYFNVFGEDPPILGFSILHRSESDPKGTGENVRSRGEFVVNLVSERNLEAMIVTAIDFPPEVSEFTEAGITPLPSVRVATPRIAESEVSFECTLFNVVPLGRLRSLVLGKVVMMHVRDEYVDDAANGRIDTPQIGLLGRAGANSYVTTTQVLLRPSITEADWRRGDRARSKPV